MTVTRTKAQMLDAFDRYGGAKWDFRKHPYFRCHVPTMSIVQGYHEAMTADHNIPVESDIMTCWLDTIQYLPDRKVVRLMARMDRGEPVELQSESI